MTEAIQERHLKLSHLIDLAMIKEVMNDEFQYRNHQKRNKQQKFVS